MKHLILTALTLLSLPLTSFAGHSVNNGVDRSLRTDHAVWFADGKRPIKACLEVSDDFGVDAGVAENAIQRAFGIWERYFAEKRIFAQLKPLGLSLATKVELNRGCRGDEDLSFYLGVHNPEVAKAADEFMSPLGFARRTSFDQKALWGKGLIWISPPAAFANYKLDWNKDDRLLGILLHEIGHVYGCGHVDGTIMRSDLSDDLLDANLLAQLQTFGKIDSGRQLILCPGCSVAYDAHLLINAPLEKLLGKCFGPDVSASMEMKEGKGLLKIFDGKKVYEITATRGSVIAADRSDVSLLSIPAAGNFGGFATFTRGLLSLLTLKYENRELVVAYRKNMQYALPQRGFVDEVLTLDPNARDNLFLRLDPKL